NLRIARRSLSGCHFDTARSILMVEYRHGPWPAAHCAVLDERAGSVWIDEQLDALQAVGATHFGDVVMQARHSQKLACAATSAAFEHFDEHRALFRLLLEEEPKVTRGSAGKRSMLRELLSRVERIVATGLEAHELRPEDAEIYPALLIGSIHGLVAHAVSRAK